MGDAFHTPIGFQGVNRPMRLTPLGVPFFGPKQLLANKRTRAEPRNGMIISLRAIHDEDATQEQRRLPRPNYSAWNSTFFEQADHEPPHARLFPTQPGFEAMTGPRTKSRHGRMME